MAAHTGWQANGILRNIAGHIRMLACIIIGIVAYKIFMRWQFPSPALLAWNSGVVLYILISVRMMMLATENSIRRRAGMIDESRFVALGLIIVTVAACFAAIIMELRGLANFNDAEKMRHASIAGFTILANWTLIHLVFSQHYAHEYFMERTSEANLPKEDRGGLRFPATMSPEYSDFIYFSFVIGVAAQTADVAITTRPMRKLNLIHCVIAFFFNATILALTINIVAGMLAS